MTLNIRSPWSAITSMFYNYHSMGKNGEIMNLNGVTGDAINILLTQRAMSPVPSLTANASSILALAMFRTACIARFLVALGSSPIVVASKNHIPFRYSNSKPLFFLQSIVTSIYVSLITFANLILTSIFRCHHIQLFVKFVIFFLGDKWKSAFEGSTYNSRPMFRRRPAQFLKKNALSFIVQMQNWFPPRGTLQENGKKTRIPASSELVLPRWELFALTDALSQDKRGEGDEKGVNFRIWERRSSFVSLILTKERREGRAVLRVVISWRPPLR